MAGIVQISSYIITLHLILMINLGGNYEFSVTLELLKSQIQRTFSNFSKATAEIKFRLPHPEF